MKYNELIETISEIVNNKNIKKEGLILTYSLSPKNHKQMHEEIFYKFAEEGDIFKESDIFEINIEGILIKFTKEEIND